jgi:hypothetical protein
VGSSTAFTFLRERDGKLEKHTANIVLGERPPPPQVFRDTEPAPPRKEPDPKGNGLRLGITLTELTQQLITEKRLTGVRGLYIKEVDPNGLAAEVRANGQDALAEGDVITRINRLPVTTLTEFQRVLGGLKAGDPIVLQVTRSNRLVDRVSGAENFRVTTRLVQFTYQ